MRSVDDLHAHPGMSSVKGALWMTRTSYEFMSRCLLVQGEGLNNVPHPQSFKVWRNHVTCEHTNLPVIDDASSVQVSEKGRHQRGHQLAKMVLADLIKAHKADALYA